MLAIGERRIPAGMAGILQAKKYRYVLNMEGFWPGDKCRIIAVIFPFALYSN